MPNKLAIDRIKVSLALRVELLVKIDKLAHEHKLSRNEIVNLILTRETNDVELSIDDMERVIQIMRKNENDRNK